MSSEKESCYFCNKEYLKLNIFSICSHRICSLCLYERIFSNHINELQGQIELKIKCKCENGYLNKKLSEIKYIIKEKEELDKNEEYEKNLDTLDEKSKVIYEGCECANNKNKSKIFSQYFCIDCLKFVCNICKLDIKNAHLKHRVINSKYLIRFLKNNIKNMKLKNERLEDFQKKCEDLSHKFENLIETNFNNTIKTIDNLISTANKLKDFYIKTYKKELSIYLQAFNYIKIFYTNYYNDKNKELKNLDHKENNIYKLKYLNNIKYEFIDMIMKHSSKFDKDLITLKKYMERMQKPEIKNKLIIGKFIFQNIQKGFKMGEQLVAHEKYINGLILTHNNKKIVTCANDSLMKVWDPYSAKVPKQIEKERIMVLYGLKNGKILASNENNISIYEAKGENKFEIEQSLTNHDKAIYALAELDNGNIISGGADKKIIIWDEDPINKLYKEKQVIKTGKEVRIITTLNDYKIAYSSHEENSINIIGAETNLDIRDISKTIKLKDYNTICKLENHAGKVNCICKLNQDLFASGGGDILPKKIIDHNIYIWKPDGKKYNLSQTISDAHDGDINSILLLRDGSFASSSKDRTIKIWKVDKYNLDHKIRFILNQYLDYKHGLYKMIQLDDDRIVSTTTDNLLIFWNNTDDIF